MRPFFTILLVSSSVFHSTAVAAFHLDQPAAPYGSALMDSGLSGRSPFTAATFPLTGLYTSAEALTNSTEAIALPGSTVSPGSTRISTNTISESCDWA